MKRLYTFSGVVFGIGLSGMASYQVRELLAALVLFTVGFATLLLITMTGVLVHKVARGVTVGVRTRAPQWNQAGREWLLGLAHSVQGLRLWHRWAHRIPAPAVPTNTD